MSKIKATEIREGMRISVTSLDVATDTSVTESVTVTANPRPWHDPNGIAKIIIPCDGATVRRWHLRPDDTVELIQMCETIGCRSVATVLATWLDGDVAVQEGVCEPCGRSYAARPALRATLSAL